MSRIGSVSRILDFRRVQKEEAEMEVRKAWEALRDEEDILGALEKSLSDTQGALAELGKHDIDNIHDLGLHYDYISTLEVKIRRQLKVIDAKTAELEVLKERLVEVFRDMKMVEILRGRLLKERDKTIQRLETRQMDAIWSSMAARESV